MTPKELRTIRVSLEVTVAELATLVRTDAASVSRWENGEAAPTPEQEQAVRRIWANANAGTRERRPALSQHH